MSLESDLYDLLLPIVGGTLIWQDLNSPRPPLPYSAMKISSVRNINRDHYSDASALGVQTVKGDRELTLNLQHYGVLNAVTVLQTVSDKLKLTTNIDKFMAKKLVTFDASQVVDISALLDKTIIEKRASVDIMLRYKSSLTDNVGIIDTVNIEADDDSLAPIYTIEVIDL